MEKKAKTIDAVALMRQIRDQMSREIEGMSYEEEKQYLKDRLRVKKQAERIEEQKKTLGSSRSSTA